MARHYIAFVEDLSWEDAPFEFATEADSLEEARLNVQELFPSGIVRSVHSAKRLEDIEALALASARRRVLSTKRALATLKASCLPADEVEQVLKAMTMPDVP